MLTRSTPIMYSTLLHIATGLRPQTFLDPVWKQTDLVTESEHARDSPIIFMWSECHWHMLKGSHSDVENLNVCCHQNRVHIKIEV